MEIDEQKLKNILKENREEFQRYIGVLKEDSDSKIKAIAEQYGDIKNTLNSHTEMIGAMKEDIEMIKVDVKTLKSDMRSVKNSLESKVEKKEFENRIIMLERESVEH